MVFVGWDVARASLDGRERSRVFQSPRKSERISIASGKTSVDSGE